MAISHKASLGRGKLLLLTPALLVASLFSPPVQGQVATQPAASQIPALIGQWGSAAGEEREKARRALAEAAVASGLQVIVSHQGKYVATCTQFIGGPGPAVVYDKAGKKLGEIPLGETRKGIGIVMWHVTAVSDAGPVVALHPVGDGPSPSLVRLYDVSGKLLYAHETDGARVLFSHSGVPVIWGCRGNDRHSFLTCLDAQGRPAAESDFPDTSLRVAEAAASSDAALVAFTLVPRDESYADRVGFWRPATGKRTELVLSKDFDTVHQRPVVSPGGQYVAVQRGRSAVCLIRTADPKVVVQKYVAATPNGPIDAVVDLAVKDSGQMLAVLHRSGLPEGAVPYAVLAPDGSVVAHGLADGFGRTEFRGAVRAGLSGETFLLLGERGHVVEIPSPAPSPQTQPAAGAVPSGLYAMAENGGGVAVRRADADGQVELGLPLTPALREATVVPTRNDNSRFNVSVVAGPVPEGSDRGHVVLAVAGLCMPVWGRSDRRPDGSVSVEATVMGQEAAGRVAEELGVKPVVRTHPGHQFTATLSPERADYLPAEVVTLVMTVKNTGQTTFRFWDGGKQRGYRNNQFSFQARRKEGKGAQVPDTGNPEHFGGMMAVKELKPGEVFRKPVEVTRWFQFDSPDTYLITGTFGLELLTEGNKTIWDDAATVSCSVRVLSPATRPAPGGPTATTRAGADSTGHPAAGG